MATLRLLSKASQWERLEPSQPRQAGRWAPEPDTGHLALQNPAPHAETLPWDPDARSSKQT